MIHLNSQWRTGTLPIRTEDQLGYLLVKVVPGAVTTRLPLNLCLVLDRSPSMREELPALRDAAQKVVDSLQDGDYLSIVVYDGYAQAIFQATKISSSSRAQAHRAISWIEEGDDTMVSQGLRAGLAELRKFHGPNVASRLVLLADGQTNGDQMLCRQRAQELARLNIQILGFGLGSDWESELFTELASMTGGSCEYLRDGRAIKTGFVEAVQQNQGIVARNATISLELSPGLRLRRVAKVQPAIEHEEFTSASTFSLVLGDISATVPTSVLFEVMMPFQNPGTYLAGKVYLAYTGADGRGGSAQADVVVTYDHNHNPSVVPEVANIVERVTAHRLRTSAQDDLDAGRVGQATQKLKNAATRLLDLGELELGRETEHLARQVEQRGGVDEAGQKALKFGTRKLTGLLRE